jgi:hypothetical protein
MQHKDLCDLIQCYNSFGLNVHPINWKSECVQGFGHVRFPPPPRDLSDESDASQIRSETSVLAAMCVALHSVQGDVTHESPGITPVK